jgi:hypothetical protein
MADLFLSGLTGGVLVNGTAWSLGKWKCPMDTKFITRNNFLSGGFQTGIKGFTKGKINCSGPYNAGNMPLAAGGIYAFTLQYSASIVLTLTGMVSNITPDNDAEDAPNISFDVESIGPFTAAIT